jgi:hypothetical protein
MLYVFCTCVTLNRGQEVLLTVGVCGYKLDEVPALGPELPSSGRVVKKGTIFAFT